MMPPSTPQAYPPFQSTQLPIRERPVYRVAADSSACNVVELLAAIIGGARQLEAAQALLTHFGSLHGVARATAVELANIPGVGEAVAARIMSAMEISRRLLTPENRREIRSPGEAAAILQPLLIHQEQEHFYVLLLDARGQMLGEPIEVYQGSLNTALLRISEVFRDAIKANASAIIVAHNHPSTVPEASPEDVKVTRNIIEAGKLLDITCLDHLIIGSSQWISLQEKGLGFN
jgi:DNA repair protein RadC